MTRIGGALDDIDLGQLWSVVTSAIPILIAQLDTLIPPLPPEIE